jgi:hypothetical protein
MAHKIKVELDTEVRDAVRNIDRFASDASKALGTVESAAGLASLGVAGIVAGFAVGAFLDGVGKIVDGIEVVINAASKEQDAVNELAAAIETSGRFTEGATERLVDFADTLEKQSKFSGEAILGVESLLASLTDLDEEGLKKATQATLDLAAVTKKDLNSAAQLLVKSVNGSEGALKKLGIEFKEGKTQAETMSNALSAINDKVGGRAQKELNTYSGAMAQAGNSFEDTLKAIGKTIIENDNLIASIGDASTAFQEITELISTNKEELKAVVEFGVKVFTVAVEASVFAIKTFISFAADMVKKLGDFKHAAGVFGIVKDNLSGVNDENAAFGVTLDKNGKILTEFGQKSEAAYEAQQYGIQEVDAALKGNVSTIKTVIVGNREIASTAVEGIKTQKQHIEELSEKQKKALEDQKKKAEEVFTQIDKKYQNTGISQIQVIEQTRDADLKALTDSYNALVQTTDDKKKLTQEYNENVQKISQDSEDKIGKIRLEEIRKTSEAAEALYDEGIKKQVKKAEEAAQATVDKIKQIFSSVTLVMGVVADVSQVERELEQLQSSESLINGLEADLALDLTSLQSDLANQELTLKMELEANIDAFAAGINDQIKAAKTAAEAEAQKKLDLIDEEAKAAEDLIYQKAEADLQNEYEYLEAKKQAGLLTNAEVEEAKLKAELANQKAIDDQLTNLAIDTEQKIKDQRIKNEEEIAAAVAAKEKELQEELKQMKLDAEEELNTLQLANQQTLLDAENENERLIREKRLALEDEIAKKRQELEKATNDASTNLVGAATKAIVDIVAPGFGSAAAAFVELLLSGGDKFKETLQAVIDNVPSIIDKLVEALPDVVAALADAGPELAFKLISKTDDIALALIKAIIKAIPEAVTSLVDGIIEGLQWYFDGLADAASRAFDPITDFFKNIFNGFIDIINQAIGFFGGDPIPHMARGGTVPGGFEGDNFPAFLQSGETVIPKDDVKNLRSFLANSENRGSGASAALERKLDQLIDLIRNDSGRPFNLSVKLAEKEVASAILNLNRQGFRTS